VYTVNDKVVRHLLASVCAKMIRGGRPLLRDNLANSLKNADFQSIFARSASAVTPSEKGSINTNRKSNTSFPIHWV